MDLRKCNVTVYLVENAANLSESAQVVLGSVDQFAHRDAEELCVFKVFICPNGFLGRYCLPPSIRQDDVWVKDTLDASESTLPGRFVEAGMNNLADFKAGRASDEDGDIAAILVLIIGSMITLGDDAPRLDRDAEPDGVGLPVLGEDLAQQGAADRVSLCHKDLRRELG